MARKTRSAAARTNKRPVSHLALGSAVRDVRKRQGLSQTELARLAKLHKNYLGGVERGERNPSLSNLLQIAKALGVKPSELFASAGL